MNYACLSCGAKYSIPETRVQSAGPHGLRIRCSRCRAIMAVSPTMMREHRADDTFGAAGAPTTALTTGVMMNPFATGALPAQFAVSAGGDAIAAAERRVPGVFLRVEDADLHLRTSPQRPVLRPTDRYYAALDGEARGPFTARELVMLAEKGKLRAGTLLWRPQASGWKPLKHITEFDVDFLRAAVRERKRREREAELLAQRKLGITPVRLERATVRSDATRPFGALFDDLDAGNITSPPTLAQLAAPAAWQVKDAAPPRPPRVRAAFVAALVGVVVVAVVVAAAHLAGLLSF